MKSLHDIKADFTMPEKEAICDAINIHGTGDHPWADYTTLQYFEVGYVIECLTEKLKMTHLTDSWKTRLLNAMDEIKSAHQLDKRKASIPVHLKQQAE